MKQKMKTKVILYIMMPLILGLFITYTSVYFLHPVDPADWYRYGFPLGWKNIEATGEGYGTPTFTFYDPTGFVLDALFWYSIVLVLTVVITHSLRLAHCTESSDLNFFPSAR
jgi:hypothetical protein